MSWDRFKVAVARLKDSTSTTEFARRDGTWAVPAGGTPYTGTIAKVMTADQSINSSTALANVTDLVFAIGANETWVYDIFCYVSSSATMDQHGLAFASTMPAGATGIMSAEMMLLTAVYGTRRGPSTLETAAPDTGVSFAAADSPPFAGARLSVQITIFNGSTAGNIQIQFAQQNSIANDLTFKKGSFGVGTKV